MQIRFVVITVCLIMAISGCGRYFMPNRHIQRTVAKSELIGVWELTSASLDLLKDDGFVSKPGHKYEIVFKADGTMEFASVHRHSEGGEYFDVEGRWKLSHEKVQGANASEVNLLDLRIRQHCEGHHFYLYFTEDNGELILWNYYGDPDSWEFIEYQKAN